jgi:hypothetical protein
MNPQIVKLLKSFETDSKIPKRKYNDFLAHVYIIFDSQIASCKSDKIMNKYKKMRNDILKYIVANERAITTEICK